MDAISRGADILVNQLSPFVDYAEVSQLVAEKEGIRPSVTDERYDTPVENLDLSVRTMNCLRRGSITTVGEIINTGEKALLSLRNFGLKSKREIDEKLNSLGLSLTPEIEEGTEEEGTEDEA